MIGNLSEATLNEIVLSVDNTDVIVTSVERILPKNNIPKLETQLHLAALIVVLVGNSCVVKRILENITATLRNFNVPICTVRLFITFLVNTTNRMISLAIVIYRFMYVVKWRWVQSPRQQRTLNIIITSMVVMVSGVLTSGVVYCRENYLRFLECEGRSQEFYYDMADFYKEFKVSLKRENNLPANHPVKISLILLFILSSVMPIIGYCVIFWARCNQDNKVIGLNPTSLQKRKRRNVVTMRYNMFNCLLELVPLLVLFIWGKNSTSEIIYSLISLCGTPLVYHIGMEANRNTDLVHAKNSLKVFKKKITVDSAEDVEEPTKRKLTNDMRVIDLDLD